MSISTFDILQYADSRTGGLRCPLCRNGEFEAVNGQDGKPVALLYEDSGRSWFGPPGYLRVFALSCKTCSNVLMFEMKAIESWIAARGGR